MQLVSDKIWRMLRTAGFLLFFVVFLSACTSPTTKTFPSPTIAAMASPTPVSTQFIESPVSLKATWQIQYTGEMDYDLDVDIYNLDLFDTGPAVIDQLKQRGVFVMCYFNAGAHEDWRPDAGQFPVEILGNPMVEWEGETWLDIRRIDLLKPIVAARLDLAIQKGCDGVDPDNIDGYQNDTGFPLTPTDQIAYNIFLSTQAHARGLSIGLKNDLDQISELLPFYDWVINEECFFYNECHLLIPFILANKPVFVIEYQLTPEEFCFQARKLNVNALRKNSELDDFRFSCN